MKNISEMTDRELFDLKDELTVFLSRPLVEHKIGFVSSDVASLEERDEAVSKLHEIRLEAWKRGFVVPTADRRDVFLRRIDEMKARLDNAVASGNVVRIYAAKDMLQANIDRLNWIEQSEDAAEHDGI